MMDSYSQVNIEHNRLFGKNVLLFNRGIFCNMVSTLRKAQFHCSMDFGNINHDQYTKLPIAI